ncbi:LuxR family transcriptional regulator [Rhodopseudomonas sp. BR0G17]|uniref:LuxR family transcriptional regulator n=1 Tax=unclassified Rhodopseudomonas TaxID=2638247 RepID=UPI0013DF0C62|nr:LuxR family transcriptional regulator [Rhodopseudomonas sp. BR0G17]NEW99090.1 LuxR family transcriptional regulator [Rhodopseudomonas sp. BR0G17]
MINGDYGRDALDFIEGLSRLSTLTEAFRAIETGFGAFGFETIIITAIPNHYQKFSQMVMAKRWPEEWFKLYTQNNYDRADPVVRHLRQNINPFEWSEAPYHRKDDQRAAEVMDRAADFRMVRGFIVPIHGLAGYEAAISLGGSNIDLNPRSKPVLHLMAMYAFDRIRTLASPAPAAPRLTHREREALIWAARGKSAWEIGEILSIAQRTAEEHISTAGRKLGAANKTHAVAIAIRQNLICP